MTWKERKQYELITMRVRVCGCQRNYGRKRSDSSTRFEWTGSLTIRDDGSLTLEPRVEDDNNVKSGENDIKNRKRVVPVSWLLSVDLAGTDEMILRYVLRDEDNFYDFNVFSAEIVFLKEPNDENGADSASSRRSSIYGRLTKALDSLIGSSLSRPKRIFVLLNPKAGWKKAVQTYEEVAAPILALAGVETERVVLSPGQDIVEILAGKENLLTEFDGVLTAGGDGTHGSVCTGIVANALRNSGSFDEERFAGVVRARVVCFLMWAQRMINCNADNIITYQFLTDKN